MTDCITTDRLTLRRFANTDAQEIVAAFVDPAMCYGLTLVPWPYTIEDAHWFLAHGTDKARAVALADGTLAGCVALGKQLGYWIAKPYWGRGYATEASRALIAAHFENSDTPVQSSYIDDNHASAAVLAKLGFQIAGDTEISIRSRGAAFPGKTVTLSRDRWRSFA